MSAGVRELSRRVLNRTLLERQLLARRVSRTPLEAIGHLVAMQAQMPNGPYVVHATMVRRTQHLARGEDFAWLWPTVAPVVRGALTDAYYATCVDGIDPDELGRVGRRLLSGRTLPRRELGQLLVEHFPAAPLAGSPRSSSWWRRWRIRRRTPRGAGGGTGAGHRSLWPTNGSAAPWATRHDRRRWCCATWPRSVRRVSWTSRPGRG